MFRDTRRCMRYLAFWGRYNQFVFIGDTRIYHMYLAFVDHLTGHESIPQIVPSNHSFHDTQLKLTVYFIWSPFVSDVMVESFQSWKVRFFSFYETSRLLHKEVAGNLLPLRLD